jgi:LacI family transcriptional regulator
MKDKINMLDIANELGISKVSVSKALSDKEGVSEELRVKVKEVAHKLGYRINNSARSLKTDRQFNIGILISEKFIMDKEAYYFYVSGEIIRKLDDYSISGIMEIITEASELNASSPRCYNEKKVDGLIVLGQLQCDYLQMIESLQVPSVFFDFYVKNAKIDSITADNFFSGYSLTNLLVSKGHKKIAYVGSIMATSSIQDRYLGYYKSLIENEISLRNEYVIEDRDDHGRLITLQLPEDLPTAFVCNCDQVAYSLVQELKKAGKKVPDDCSVVGFDNSLYSTLVDPQITTVDHNIDKMVSTAVKVITKKIANPQRTYDRILVPGTIIERFSVKDLRLDQVS